MAALLRSQAMWSMPAHIRHGVRSMWVVDEESTTSSEKYSSNAHLIRSNHADNSNYARAGSANPSSLGHESGFQSSASLRSLTPSLIAGSLYECPISTMDKVGAAQTHIGDMSSDSLASLTSGMSFLQIPGLAGRRHSL